MIAYTDRDQLVVEIRRISFVNKGAEMMLLSAMQDIGKRIKKATFVVEPRLKYAEYEDRINLGLLQKINPLHRNVICTLIVGLLPLNIRKSYGLVKSKEIDVILDAAGFAYSDQWGYRNCIELALSSIIWRVQGTCVILLPQALGPFDRPLSKYLVRFAVAGIKLIYARDEISYEHLTSVVGKLDKVKISSDFTCNLKARVDTKYLQIKGGSCLILNKRIVDMTTQENSSRYLKFVNDVLVYFENRNMPIFILIHESEDLELSRSVICKLGYEERVPIIIESDPCVLKNIIGSSKLVIGSRYHGLVSALSQGVPAMGVGWSHKYERLFNDYDFQQGLVKLNEDYSDISKLLETFVNASTSSELKCRLSAKAALIKNSTELMWNEVVETIEKFKSASTS